MKKEFVAIGIFLLFINNTQYIKKTSENPILYRNEKKNLF